MSARVLSTETDFMSRMFMMFMTASTMFLAPPLELRFSATTMLATMGSEFLVQYLDAGRKSLLQSTSDLHVNLILLHIGNDTDLTDGSPLNGLSGKTLSNTMLDDAFHDGVGHTVV
uniref:Uncharacterized protein n=1 Tax=Anopheles farauti TaxID=69004 RepID=A0A182QA41_9DIPT